VLPHVGGVSDGSPIRHHWQFCREYGGERCTAIRKYLQSRWMVSWPQHIGSGWRWDAAEGGMVAGLLEAGCGM
jgi:hypothetical protein